MNVFVRQTLTAAAVCAAALSLTSSVATLAALGGQQIEDDGIAPSARAQIQALLDEKETRTPAERKIDSQLLYARRMQLGIPIAPGVQTLEVYVPHADDGHVVVNVRATVTNRLVQSLSGMTGEMKRTGGTELQLHVALDQIEAIAEQPDVQWIGPRQEAYTSRRNSASVPPAGDRATRRAAVLGSLRAALNSRSAPTTFVSAPPAAAFATQDMPPQQTNVYTVGSGQGSVTAQSDITHRAAVFRGLTGFNGAGVKVGVLSDGVQHLADAQFSGDLGAVTVLPGQTGSGDEGTAMLEIIHDLAPGAQLYFATAFTSITSFAANIKALRTAGCDIIVDDVGYYVESPFQDGQAPAVVSQYNSGIVAQAVKDVAAAGAMYFSAAANSGNFDAGTSGTWEGDFNPGAATASPVTTAGTLHRFTGLQDYDSLTSSSGLIYLFWSDPLGGSGNDYDLFRLNSTGTAVSTSSTNIQDGNDDPVEAVAGGSTGERIVIVKKSTAAVRALHLDTNRGSLSVATAGSTHGHATTSSLFSFAVAATPAVGPFPNPFGPSNVVETFSSDGPRKLFYQENSAPITAGNLLFGTNGGTTLTKPDFTAADGVFVTGAGAFPGQFYGTSAAAPNAAAIMALIKSQNPGFTQTQLRNALLATAIDIQAPGYDRNSGAGIVMAMAPQAGCTFSTTGSVSSASSGGTSPIGITASSPSCNWVVFSNVPWIKITNGAGIGSGSYTITVEQNRGPSRNGSYTIAGGPTVPVGQGGIAVTAFDQTAPVAIPNPGTVDSSIAVASLTQPISKVSVSLYLTYPYDADLTIQLIAPDGTIANLSVANGSSGSNYGSSCSTTSRTTFDDGAATYVANASAPFVGLYRPEQPLSMFNGKSGASANGTWKLRISDSFPLDSGTLQCWSLNISQGSIPGVAGDFNGNGSADLAVFRPGTGQWFINGGSNSTFGSPGDVPVAGDYNGDGVTDVAVYRPSTGQWFLTSPASIVQYGRTGDIPVPADYDGDKKTDLAVYRTTEGTGGIWYLNLPGQAPVALGQRGDIPMPGDYDGDGRADLAVYRPATGEWIVATAASGFTTVTSSSWGVPGDIPVRADVDNDGKLDHVVYRPSSGTWFMAPTTAAVSTFQLGLPGDIPVAQDLDGDGYPELTVWRPATGTWYIRNRITSVTTSVQYGLAGDIPIGARPRLPYTPDGDIDGDGITDLTVFRASTGTWYTRYSSSGFALSTATATQFGLAGDIPVPGDYDGDHHTDYAVFRPSTNVWYILQSSTGTLRVVGWGAPGDRPVPADYDGDGQTDIAVWRPSTGEWWVINSSNGALSLTQWGLSSDQPIAADFDGDGRADLAVFRPSTAQWYLHLTTTAYGAQLVRTWGQAGDVPVAADYDGDGRTDIAIYRPSLGQWVGLDALTLGLVVNVQFGLGGDTPRPHDFDGDGVADPVVFRPGSATWFIRPSTTGTLQQIQWGLPTDQPELKADGGQ